MSQKNKRDILIISYAFAPDKRVGAMRANYWYKNLGKVFNADVSVVTNEENAIGDNVHIVRKEGSSWLTKFIADDGLIWKKNIVEYMNHTPSLNPDYVILTGGPFMQFGIANWLKSTYGCKVILDYRDPFASNPLFGSSRLKITIKKFFEKKFNKQADALVTVNEYCGKLISNFDSKKNMIIQNGFDESIDVKFEKPSFGNHLTLSYAGKFYFDPKPMQDAIQDAGLRLVYMGQDESRLNLNTENITSEGFLEYKKAIEVISSNDIGVIQTAGFKHLSTTKLFDYIRCERAILIISSGPIEYGSIQEELKGYPNVFWVTNECAEISATLERIKSSKYILPPVGFSDKYSRKYQLKHLVNLLESFEA